MFLVADSPRTIGEGEKSEGHSKIKAKIPAV